MNFSEEWKSLWPISSVFSPPLLLSGPSAKPLGPLFFIPSPETLTLLFSFPSFSPPFPFLPRLSLPRFLQTTKDTFILPSDSNSIAADFDSQSGDTRPIINNNLQMLRCPNNDVLVFFPTGENLDRVGFIVLSAKESNLEARVDKDGSVFTTQFGFYSRILKLFVNSVAAAGLGFSASTGNSVTVGLLLACTLYSVHWFSVEIRECSSNLEEPVLFHLGTKKFKSCSVVHACWSPHLAEESVVLLESGELFLFDLVSCSGAGKLKGTRIGVSWDGLDDWEKGKWLSCEFAWHPRILLVACSTAVFLVDFRFEESNVSILAKIEMFEMSHLAENDRFVAFSKAGFDGYYFMVTTEYWLLLFDIRKPLTPMLQWAHGLDNPCYIREFRLSELRSQSKDDEYAWASESGYAILVGSFWNCEFSLFCYGPSLPASEASIASKLSKFCNSLYAWELPSELSLSGRDCHCGNCLVREDFSKTALPVWIHWQQKKEIVMGFGILDKDLSASQSQLDSLGGFTLIRLMSSGKLELQKYRASWNFIKRSEEVSGEASLQFGDSLIYPLVDQKYKFPKRYKYLKLDYLYGYLNGDLAKVVVSNMQKPHVGPIERKSFIQDFCELLCEKLKSCGVNKIGSSPAMTDVFYDVSLPSSIHEIASRRIWTGLTMDLLHLAFSNYAELLEVLVDQKKVSLDFLDIPDLPQLPPFFLRKPSGRSNKWSQKVQPGNSLVGPVLPLPILLTLREAAKEKKFSVLEEDESDGSSVETELTRQCNEVMKVANEMVHPVSFSGPNDSPAVSLADDREEKWLGSQELKPFFLYNPQAFSETKGHTMDITQDKPVFKDERFATFVSKMHEKELVPNARKELVGLEMFDELCPVELKFDSPPMKFGPNELKGYKLLKRQFSKWQEDFKPYQDFCTLSKIQKRAP
ncbi:hypothetical protein HHK36_027623 [Tetracentron sinense]|uniref:Uncharacterized protein n=1 Tax=Tetracentron sinense TaxID=13715 RepID=A0A835D1Q6_TETSI|nr:hypothetical protein HHK36_027623 [Tetracentron sinense]